MRSFLDTDYRSAVQQSIPPYIQSLVANNGRGEVADRNSLSVAKTVRRVFEQRSQQPVTASLQRNAQQLQGALAAHATTIVAYGAQGSRLASNGTGAATAAAGREEVRNSTIEASRSKQTAILVTNVAKGFLNPLSTHTIVLASYRNHVIEPAYIGTENRFAQASFEFVKRYIVLLSIGDRAACLGLSFALLAMTAVRVATTALFAVAALFSSIATTLTGTRNNWCRNQLIVQLSQLVGSGVLAAANFIGIFHLSTRAQMVLETADMFSNRDFLTTAINTTHLVQGHAK